MGCCCKNPKCKINVLLARQAKEIMTLRWQLAAEKRRTTNGAPMPTTLLESINKNLPWDWSQPPE